MLNLDINYVLKKGLDIKREYFDEDFLTNDELDDIKRIVEERMRDNKILYRFIDVFDGNVFSYDGKKYRMYGDFKKVVSATDTIPDFEAQKILDLLKESTTEIVITYVFGDD